MAKETKKNQLGKGIRALLSHMDDAEPKQKEEIVQDLTTHSNALPMDWIEVNPFQPRVEFESDALAELAASIQLHGLIQPITVRRLSDRTFQIISGERRFRAAKLAGLSEIPAYIRLADDQGMLEMALIENVQRQDLNAMEVAVSLERLMQECDLTHESLSERIGKKRSTVSNYLRLLKLPPEIQKSVKRNVISMGHARALAGIDNLSLQLTIHKELINKELSVRALERLIQSYQKPAPKPVAPVSSAKSAEMEHMENHLKSIFGSKVMIRKDQKGKGKIEIHFNSVDNLNYILDILGEIE
jgi:ParB family chromosome partitioning protein